MPCWQKWIITGDLSVLPRERETGVKRRVLLKMALVRSGRATQARGLPRCQLSSSSSRALLRQPCGSLGLCAGQGASQRDGLWVFFFYFCHLRGCQTSTLQPSPRRAAASPGQVQKSSRGHKARLQQELASGPAAPQNLVLGPQEGRTSQPRAWAASVRADPGPCPHPGAAGTRPQHGPAAPGSGRCLSCSDTHW